MQMIRVLCRLSALTFRITCSYISYLFCFIMAIIMPLLMLLKCPPAGDGRTSATTPSKPREVDQISPETTRRIAERGRYFLEGAKNGKR